MCRHSLRQGHTHRRLERRRSESRLSVPAAAAVVAQQWLLARERAVYREEAVDSPLAYSRPDTPEQLSWLARVAQATREIMPVLRAEHLPSSRYLPLAAEAGRVALP